MGSARTRFFSEKPHGARDLGVELPSRQRARSETVLPL